MAVLFDHPVLVTTTHAITDGNGLVIPRSQLRELFELEPRVACMCIGRSKDQKRVTFRGDILRCAYGSYDNDHADDRGTRVADPSMRHGGVLWQL